MLGLFRVHLTGQLGVICLEKITRGHHFIHSSEDSFITADVGYVTCLCGDATI